eukprot:c16673_g2_i1 orf=288-1217(-)
MRSSAAMLRPMLRHLAASEPQGAVGVYRSVAAALWQVGARSFNSRASGNDFRGMDLYSTDSFTRCPEEEEHPNMFARRDLDGLVPASEPQVHEGIGSTPLRPTTTLWAPLSCGCLAPSNQMGMTKRPTISPAQHTGPMNSKGSVMLSNSYASSSRFEDKAKIRALMEARGLKKEPGWSRIEIQGQLNTFLVDDKSHPRNKEIRVELQRMLGLMKDAGYVADLRCVLRDIPESEKEHALQHHSERLAMALGHISLPPRAPMRVIKNLRVCNDCHVATKYFAYICKREIIVRDATRFHHFREGYCSCGDYW